jgi:hypothetical protein
MHGMTLRLTRYPLMAVLVLAAAVRAAPAPDSSAPQPFRGSAFDTERGGPAYNEEHHEVFRQGRLVSTRTLFTAPSGGTMAQRDLDFSNHPFKPEYLFKDARNGYQEGSKVVDAELLVHFRDSARAPLKEKRIKVPEPCVVNGGLGPFLKQNWKALAAGQRVGFNMVVPARLDFYKFVAYVDDKLALSDKDSKGRRNKAVVIEPQSSLLRMLLPTIVMVYDVGTLRLIRYQGIVNVADPKGRSLRVRVDYPGPGP